MTNLRVTDMPYVSFSDDYWLFPVELWTPMKAHRWLRHEDGERYRLERLSIRLHDCNTDDLACRNQTDDDPNGTNCPQSVQMDCWKAVPA